MLWGKNIKKEQNDSTLVIQNREPKIELEKLNMSGIRCKQIAIWCAPSNVYQCILAMEYTIIYLM